MLTQIYNMTCLGHNGVIPWGRKKGQHFAGDIFKLIFLNETLRIFIHISLNLVHEGPINNKPTLSYGNGLALIRWQAVIWTSDSVVHWHIDELMQERRNSGAFTRELRLFCINPSIYEYLGSDEIHFPSEHRWHAPVKVKMNSLKLCILQWPLLLRKLTRD